MVTVTHTRISGMGSRPQNKAATYVFTSTGITEEELANPEQMIQKLEELLASLPQSEQLRFRRMLAARERAVSVEDRALDEEMFEYAVESAVKRIRDHEERAGRQAAEEARPAWRGLLDALDEQIQAATTIQKAYRSFQNWKNKIVKPGAKAGNVDGAPGAPAGEARNTKSAAGPRTTTSHRKGAILNTTSPARGASPPSRSRSPPHAGNNTRRQQSPARASPPQLLRSSSPTIPNNPAPPGMPDTNTALQGLPNNQTPLLPTESIEPAWSATFPIEPLRPAVSQGAGAFPIEPSRATTAGSPDNSPGSLLDQSIPDAGEGDSLTGGNDPGLTSAPASPDQGQLYTVFEERSNLDCSPEQSEEEWGRSVSSMTDSDEEARSSKGSSRGKLRSREDRRRGAHAAQLDKAIAMAEELAVRMSMEGAGAGEGGPDNRTSLHGRLSDLTARLSAMSASLAVSAPADGEGAAAGEAAAPSSPEIAPVKFADLDPMEKARRAMQAMLFKAPVPAAPPAKGKSSSKKHGRHHHKKGTSRQHLGSKHNKGSKSRAPSAGSSSGSESYGSDESDGEEGGSPGSRSSGSSGTSSSGSGSEEEEDHAAGEGGKFVGRKAKGAGPWPSLAVPAPGAMTHVSRSEVFAGLMFGGGLGLMGTLTAAAQEGGADGLAAAIKAQVATMVEALPVAAVSEELPQLLRIRELTAQAAEAAQVAEESRQQIADELEAEMQRIIEQTAAEAAAAAALVEKSKALDEVHIREDAQRQAWREEQRRREEEDYLAALEAADAVRWAEEEAARQLAASQDDAAGLAHEGSDLDAEHGAGAETGVDTDAEDHHHDTELLAGGSAKAKSSSKHGTKGSRKKGGKHPSPPRGERSRLASELTASGDRKLRGSQDRKQRDYNAAPAWTGTRGGTGTGYFGSTTGTLVGADGKWHANPAPPRSSLRVADVVKGIGGGGSAIKAAPPPPKFVVRPPTQEGQPLAGEGSGHFGNIWATDTSLPSLQRGLHELARAGSPISPHLRPGGSRGGASGSDAEGSGGGVWHPPGHHHLLAGHRMATPPSRLGAHPDDLPLPVAKAFWSGSDEALAGGEGPGDSSVPSSVPWSPRVPELSGLSGTSTTGWGLHLPGVAGPSPRGGRGTAFLGPGTTAGAPGMVHVQTMRFAGGTSGAALVLEAAPEGDSMGEQELELRGLRSHSHTVSVVRRHQLHPGGGSGGGSTNTHDQQYQADPSEQLPSLQRPSTTGPLARPPLPPRPRTVAGQHPASSTAAAAGAELQGNTVGLESGATGDGVMPFLRRSSPGLLHTPRGSAGGAQPEGGVPLAGRRSLDVLPGTEQPGDLSRGSHTSTPSGAQSPVGPRSGGGLTSEKSHGRGLGGGTSFARPSSVAGGMSPGGISGSSSYSTTPVPSKHEHAEYNARQGSTSKAYRSVARQAPSGIMLVGAHAVAGGLQGMGVDSSTSGTGGGQGHTLTSSTSRHARSTQGQAAGSASDRHMSVERDRGSGGDLPVQGGPAVPPHLHGRSVAWREDDGASEPTKNQGPVDLSQQQRQQQDPPALGMGADNTPEPETSGEGLAPPPSSPPQDGSQPAAASALPPPAPSAPQTPVSPSRPGVRGKRGGDAGAGLPASSGRSAREAHSRSPGRGRIPISMASVTAGAASSTSTGTRPGAGFVSITWGETDAATSNRNSRGPASAAVSARGQQGMASQDQLQDSSNTAPPVGQPKPASTSILQLTTPISHKPRLPPSLVPLQVSEAVTGAPPSARPYGTEAPLMSAIPGGTGSPHVPAPVPSESPGAVPSPLAAESVAALLTASWNSITGGGGSASTVTGSVLSPAASNAAANMSALLTSSWASNGWGASTSVTSGTRGVGGTAGAAATAVSGEGGSSWYKPGAIRAAGRGGMTGVGVGAGRGAVVKLPQLSRAPPR